MLVCNRPDPLPAGTSGYSPEWVKQNGLWEAGADRFSTGVLIGEILGWQFEDVRTEASPGDTYFAEDEFGHKTDRYNLLIEYLGQLNPELPKLFDTTWHANNTEECPRIAEWNRVLAQIPEEQTTLSWGWEPLDLPADVYTPESIAPQPIEVVEPTRQYKTTQTARIGQLPTCPACGREIQIEQTQCPYCRYELVGVVEAPTQSPVVETIVPQTGSIVVPEIIAKPWPNKGGGMAIRKQALFRVFMLFTGLGILLLIFILVSGGLLDHIKNQLVSQGGMIFPQAFSNGILALLVGSMQALIFHHHMSRSRVWLYILASITGGIIGGAVAGGLTNLGILKDSITTGALIGATAGTLSSIWQNTFMHSSGVRTKWFIFSLITWTIIWAIGMTISWSLGSTVTMAIASAFILISSGAALAGFLSKSPEIEF